MICKSPTLIRMEGNLFRSVPCRKCLPCKINKTSEWTMRLLMELNNEEWKNNAIFLTLTYNNENLPEDRSCHIDEISKYNKALRQEGLKFKFFACSEYGDNPERLTYFGNNVDPELVKRPHYHIIYFGIDNSLSIREILYRHWQKCDSWKFFGRKWYETVGNVTKDSCSYVAGYCQKKLFGEMAVEEYGDREPPLQRQSQSIGEKYFLNHIEQYSKDGFILFNGKRHPIPEIWKRKYNIKIDPEVEFNLFSEKVIAYNERHNLDLDPLDTWMWAKYHSALTKYDFIQKSYDDQKAYADYIDWKNNLRKKGQKTGGKK